MALTKATLIDLNSNELILDLDADTSITADTDDTIHFKIAGADEIVMTGTALTPAVADGSALGSTSLEWSDIFLADGAVINFGADQDINITHVADTGLTTNADFTVGDDLFVSGGLIDLKNTGTVSTIKFYCESSNAHAQSLIGAPHSEGATNTLTLPGTGGDARLVSTTSTATLTNKTLTTPVIAEIDSGSTITLDATTDIILDADGADIILKDGGTTFATFTNSSTDFIIESAVSDKDIIFKVNDGGSSTEVMRLDGDVSALLFGSNKEIRFTDANESIKGDGSNLIIKSGGTAFTVPASDGSSGQAMVTNGSGVLSFASVSANTPSSADGQALGSASLEWSDLFLADGGQILFGNDQDVTLTHNADKGLILKSIATADDKPAILTLQTGETDMAANDVMGKIEFQAPDEGTGTDAILVAAAIQAKSEGDFSSSSNATSLEFMTGASEAATAKVRITSAGHLVPTADDSYDLGTSSLQWRNIYTGDLHLSNMTKDVGNSVDGTKGDWTIQEGAEDLFLINNNSGKKYKFNLTEV